jgi:hypothetical protein
LDRKEVERSLRRRIKARFAEKREWTVVEKVDQRPFYRKKRVDGRERELVNTRMVTENRVKEENRSPKKALGDRK